MLHQSQLPGTILCDCAVCGEPMLEGEQLVESFRPCRGHLPDWEHNDRWFCGGNCSLFPPRRIHVDCVGYSWAF